MLSLKSEKSHQNLRDYIQFSLKKDLNSIEKMIIKWEIQIIICIIMLPCSSEMIFNPSRYTDLIIDHFCSENNDEFKITIRGNNSVN